MTLISRASWQRFSLSATLLFALCLSLPRHAAAQLTVQLNSATLTAAPGSTIAFTGSLSNSSSAELFLNGFDYDFGFSGAFFTGDIGALVPLSLGANATFTGDLFVVQIAPATPLQSYAVGITLSGGSNDQASSILARPNVQVVVASSSAPEPASLALLGFTLPAIAFVRRKRHGA